MSTLTKIIFGTVLLLVAGGAIFLMTWDIPAPSQPVSKTLNNDQFPG